MFLLLQRLAQLLVKDPTMGIAVECVMMYRPCRFLYGTYGLNEESLSQLLASRLPQGKMILHVNHHDRHLGVPRRLE